MSFLCIFLLFISWYMSTVYYMKTIQNILTVVIVSISKMISSPKKMAPLFGKYLGTNINSDRKWMLLTCGHFRTISGHFFANYMNIFHKTEIQTVILRCLMSLKLNRCKSYDTKCKNPENANESFFSKSQKNGDGNICLLCHNFWTNWYLELLSTSKWPSESQFCERCSYSWQKNGQ